MGNMALIKCKECGKKVSNKAEVCVECGYPIKVKKDTTAVEYTKKSLKLQLFISKYLSISLFIGLFIMVQLNNKNYNTEFMIMFYVFLLISLPWYLLTRIRIWWNHS